MRPTALAGTISIDANSLNKVALSNQSDAKPMHHKRRHYNLCRGVLVGPNTTVAVEGSNSSASKSRLVAGHGNCIWSAKRSPSVTKYIPLSSAQEMAALMPPHEPAP